MEKKIKNTLLDVNEFLSFLQERKVEYVSPEGEAYLDGLRMAGYKFKFVPRQEYDELYAEYVKAIQTIKKLKGKSKFF
jgi:hypothetical protein